jgi:hypothetical protein
MSWKTWLDWIIKLVLVIGLVFCLFGIRKQNVVINKLQVANIEQSQALADFAELGDLIADYNDKLNSIAESVEGNLVDTDALVNQVLQEIQVGDELKDGRTDKEFALLKQRIAQINEMIKQLNSKESVTVSDLEALVDNALVNISKPVEALVVKPMPNTTTIVHRVTLSDKEKADLMKRTTAELYKAFEKAGYGDFVDGEFVLRKPFYGAEIRAGDEWKYEPVQTLD